MDLDNSKLKFIVSFDATIENAWRIIEENNQRSVIVLDGEKVVGSLSDGDIRKAMLLRRLVSTPVSEVMNLNFISLSVKRKVDGVKIFHKNDIFLIPVVDENLKLKDILVRKDTLK